MYVCFNGKAIFINGLSNRIKCGLGQYGCLHDGYPPTIQTSWFQWKHQFARCTHTHSDCLYIYIYTHMAVGQYPGTFLFTTPKWPATSPTAGMFTYPIFGWLIVTDNRGSSLGIPTLKSFTKYIRFVILADTFRMVQGGARPALRFAGLTPITGSEP